MGEMGNTKFDWYKRALGRPRHRREDNKMAIRERGCKGLNLTHLVQDAPDVGS
jgi:hypothetical protein